MRAYSTITVMKLSVALVCISLSVGLGGCHAVTYHVSLAHDELATPQQTFSGHILMQKQADDRREVPWPNWLQYCANDKYLHVSFVLDQIRKCGNE